MRSWTRRPTGLSTRAVTTAVSRPKQRFKPRATLYSPPPSHASKRRVVWIRPSPGSRRSITSPSATRSNRHDALSLIFRSSGMFPFPLRQCFYEARRPLSNPQPATNGSHHQHGVAVAVEAIAGPDRVGVCAEDLVPPRERADEQQQRRLREVEVGEQ